MTLKQFIQNNREELKGTIEAKLGFIPSTASCYCSLSGTSHRHSIEPLTQKDLREWVLNDEGLYRWARSEGVRI